MMDDSRTLWRRGALFALLWLLVLGWTPALASSIGVALVLDGPADTMPPIGRALVGDPFKDELQAIAEGEFDLHFKTFAGQWTRESVLQASEAAYADPEVDLLLVSGIAANQIVAARGEFPKATFLPIVFDSRLSGLPQVEQGSGVPNLNYLSDNADFATNLENYLAVVPFERLGILLDTMLLSTADELTRQAKSIASGFGIDLVVIPFDDPEGDIVSLIPEDVDAVMTGGLIRLSEGALNRLVADLIERQLPSFSFEGDALVRQGLMVTDSPDSDWQRLARRTALNIQAVLLGERAEDQPVDFEARQRLYLNLETARNIEVYPRFDVLVEAVLINEYPHDEGPPASLGDVAREAVEANLDLLAQRQGVEAGLTDIRDAQATLLPQVSAGLSVSQLDSANAAVTSGASARRSTSASLTATQLLWEEKARAGVDIQRFVQRSREADLETTRLDIVQGATLAFLDVLLAETQVRVQRDNLELTRANLELARDRVRVGTANPSDIYRWESQLATDRQSAISAYASRLRSRENLNRLLHRPLDAPLAIQPAGLEDPDLLFSEGEYGDVVDNPRTFRRLVNFVIGEGLERAPELQSLDAGIEAKQREILSIRREWYSPSVALQGQISGVVEEDRPGEDILEGEFDWSLGLSASLDLYTGGSRRARLARAELELAQLQTQRESARESIELNIRSNFHLANASYMSISLAQEAATAARKSLELVTDSYSQGAVSIIDLLDAQNAALQAEEGAANAVYAFLIDLMNVQRAQGRFDFFIPTEERRNVIDRTQNYLERED